MRMEKGKLIVIDGGDGSGKKTQTKLLVERLQNEGVAVETLDFPQYTNNTFGALLKECLKGERGDFLSIDPHIASTLYAADRFESKGKIEAWLSEGKIVIIDRYVSSNMLHQGGKIEDETERAEFLGWLDKVEHDIFGIPRPDVIIYCSLDPHIRMQLLEAEAKETNVDTDTAEKDLVHQAQADTAAAHIVAQMNNWQTVECAPGGELRTIEDIHEEIYQKVMSV